MRIVHGFRSRDDGTSSSTGGGGTSGSSSSTGAVAEVEAIDIADPVGERIVRVEDMTGTNWTVDDDDHSADVALGPDGRIHFADNGILPRVFRLDDISGAGEVTYGSSGSGMDQFLLPWGIYVH